MSETLTGDFRDHQRSQTEARLYAINMKKTVRRNVGVNQIEVVIVGVVRRRIIINGHHCLSVISGIQTCSLTRWLMG